MPIAQLALDALTERTAVNVLRHLEWQADGFSLVFLFLDVGPSLQLADWLDQRLALQGRPLRRQDVRDDFVHAPEAAVDGLVARLAEISGQPGALWYGMQRHPSDARWNRARRLFLARLNERRFLLNRDLARPLVLALPSDFRAEARSIAPDLWHVRALSEELRAAIPASREDAPARTERVLARPAIDASFPAYREWQRIQANLAPDGVFLPTAWRACEELLSAGRPGDAEEVASTALSLARHRVGQAKGYAALRDLSVSLDNVGEVARARGDWAEAEAVYRESLDLRRQLVERLGGTPEALDDLAVSLLHMALVPPGYSGALAEAVGIYESLAARFPDVPRYAERLAAARGGS